MVVFKRLNAHRLLKFHNSPPRFGAVSEKMKFLSFLLALSLSSLVLGAPPATGGKAVPSVSTPTRSVPGARPSLSGVVGSGAASPAGVGSAAALPTVYAPTRPRTIQPRYPWKSNIVTTVFWIGEGPSSVSSAANHHSSWDTQWMNNYGGFDNPDPAARASDFRPKAFEPGQNPFYCALPFNDVSNKGIAPTVIPWFRTHPNRNSGTVCKSAWVAVRYGKKVCYMQWEDCGPFVTDDWSYVFGSAAQPKNTGNGGAGLDVSPAVRDYLGMFSGARCDWRFCDVSEVPDGPWRKYGANNPFTKQKDQELQSRIKRMEQLERQREQWLKTVYNPSLGY